jgi:hypothetical protein
MQEALLRLALFDIILFLFPIGFPVLSALAFQFQSTVLWTTLPAALKYHQFVYQYGHRDHIQFASAYLLFSIMDFQVWHFNPRFAPPFLSGFCPRFGCYDKKTTAAHASARTIYKTKSNAVPTGIFFSLNVVSTCGALLI